MIKLINLLTEGYSFTGPKKMGGEDDGEVIYNFKNKKGDNIFVSLSNEYEGYWETLVGPKAKSEDITEDDLILDVAFGKSKGDTWGQTESGDGLAVLNTVGDILKKFIEVDFKGYGKFTFQCHPATEKNEKTSRDSKRDRIYQMFAEKMMKQLPYVTDVYSVGNSWGDEEYQLYVTINKTK
jgi:hypothetical protein